MPKIIFKNLYFVKSKFLREIAEGVNEFYSDNAKRGVYLSPHCHLS